ncbi:MAG: DUF4013 domain-containing protein [Methanobrevibacter sp.]|uniref:DUF4013 domain-containing protein n=1 Tax=Methanobrevibacter sp. TaxID=66852 RepID=UPI003F0B9BE3
MPHVIIKKVWEYCSYNKGFLLFLFALLFVSSLIRNYIWKNSDYYDGILLQILISIIVSGYGMTITQSRINHGKQLPKIIIKEIFSLGVKSRIITSSYILIQGFILGFICFPLGFPAFDLEELLLNWPDTINMLFNHDPTSTILFVFLGAIVFYMFSFFMEIALAKLADTKSILPALNLLSIKKSIDILGWKNYAKEYTRIILTIVILSYLLSYNLTFTFIDLIIDMFLSFLIFVTQYLGIGAVYCKIKDLEIQ